MTRRAKVWIGALIFTVANAAGAVAAGVQGEFQHAGGHLVLMALGAYVASRFLVRRSPVAIPVQPSELGDFLTHIEQSVDAVAIEVERLGEGQRFITRMLEQRERSRELPR